jgi:lipoprotein-releasing system permease protein
MADAPAPTRPFAAFEWMLASRYLRARRRDGFISVIAGFSFVGIMLGVATLIIVLSVMNGFRSEILDKIVGINGHMFLQPIDRPLSDYEQVAARIDKVVGVARAVPMIEGQAFASSAFAGGGVLVRGVRESDIKRMPSIAGNIRQGTLEGFDKGEGVAIGRRLAEQLTLRAGDMLTLIAPGGPSTPFGNAPRRKAYRVAAVFEIGMSEFDSAFVYLPLSEAQLYFDRENEVSVIEVTLTNADDLDDLRDAVEQAAERPIVVSDWRQRNRTFFGALQVERNMMFLILTLIVLVAALNIVSGLTMLVKEKTADIAILRTMGATRGAVTRVFFIAGAAIGVVGTIAGFVLGLLVTLNVENIRQFITQITNTNLFPAELYFLSRLPARIDPAEVATIVLMALVLSILATIYPSWRAARVEPVTALRMG